MQRERSSSVAAVVAVLAILMIVGLAGVGVMIYRQRAAYATQQQFDSIAADLAEPMPVPAEYVGIWRWQYADNAGVEHVVLHEDGTAQKYLSETLVHSTGVWYVVDGELHVTFDGGDSVTEFRIDSETELMDKATIPTDRDFPWYKVETIGSLLDD